MSNANQFAAIERRLKKYVNKDIPAATRTATNKAMSLAKTRLIRGVAKEAKVRPGAVRKRVKMIRASAKGPAKFVISRRGVSIIDLGARQNKRGVRAAGRQFDRAFIGTVQGGGRGYKQVLYRQGAARLPLWLPRIPIKMAVTRITPKVVARVFNGHFERLYQHEIKRRSRRT
ncbi:MAG: phage tail protein [Bermanella sp.]